MKVQSVTEDEADNVCQHQQETKYLTAEWKSDTQHISSPTAAEILLQPSVHNYHNFGKTKMMYGCKKETRINP